jgi:hypothetical protein
MYLLHEQSDVFVDACVSDHRAQLLFISVFGRDTSIQQLMARIHQRVNQGGVDHLSVASTMQGRPLLRVLVGDPLRLDKVTGRCPKNLLLGNLLHAWIFDPCVLQLDQANGCGWLLDHGEEPEPAQLARRLWRLLQELSPVPLLDHWATTVLAHIDACGAVKRPPRLGPVTALRLELPDGFVPWVSQCVRNGVLTESASHQDLRGQFALPLAA